MSGLRLWALTALAMMAFAANSVLNRMAVGPGWIAPMDFALLRLMAGAGVLALILGLRQMRGGVVWSGWRGRGAGVFGLCTYLAGFSLAYLDLAAGIGALILFGSVQVTMFSGAVLAREHLPLTRWVGAGLAFAGLVWLVAPGGAEVPLTGAAAMACAGVGWGLYSLAGRGAVDAVAATAWNFILALPVLAVGVLLLSPPDWGGMEARGVWLALVSGAVTSGLGYALWYGVVPHLGAARAGVAQLTVPMIAALGGALMLGEGMSLRFALASLLILGGVALASRQSALPRR
jgi:drug/metabolite transporter (DMT)-like permease